MPRTKSIDPTTDTGPGADLLNGPLKSAQINIFKGMAAHPKVLEAFLGFSKGVKAGALSEAEHEVIALVSGQLRKCEYCTAAHTALGQKAGLSEDETVRIREGKSEDPKRQALVSFTKAVIETNGFVSDEQLQSFRDAGYDDEAVIEVIAGIAVNTFTNLFNHVHETEVDFPVPASV